MLTPTTQSPKSAGLSAASRGGGATGYPYSGASSSKWSHSTCLTAIRKCCAPASRDCIMAWTVTPLGAALSAATMTLESGPLSIGFKVAASVSRVTGVSSRRMRLSWVIVSVTGVLGCMGSARPWGRLTASECRFCIDSEASINVTSRKNITSIIGMISIRPRRCWRDLRSFMGTLLQTISHSDVVHHSRSQPFHLVEHLRLPARKEIEREKGNNGNKKAQRGSDQGLGHPCRHSGWIDQAVVADQVE